MTKRRRRRSAYPPGEYYEGEYAPRGEYRGEYSREGQRPSEYYPGRKSHSEERVERLTWFLLVFIFAVVQVLTEGGVTFPNWFVPLSGSIVLLGSAMYQYSRRWRVSPTTWLAGALMAGLVFVNLYVSPTRNYLGICLIVFAGVILIGVITGET